MPTRDKLLLTLVMIVAIGLGAAVLTMVNSESSSAALADAGSAHRIQALSDQVEFFAARLSAIETRLDQPGRQPLARAREQDLDPVRRDVTDGGAPADLMDRLVTRVSALEQRLMESGIADPWVSPSPGATAEELRKAFDVLTERRARVVDDGRTLLDHRRVELCRRLLTEYPRDAPATMFEDIVRNVTPAEARDLLRDLGGRAGFKDWHIKQLEANTYRLEEGEQRRSSLRAVADAQAAPDYQRARALEGIAYSLRFDKKYGDALTVLRDLIARYESSAGCNREVEIARKAIQEIESGKP